MDAILVLKRLFMFLTFAQVKKRKKELRKEWRKEEISNCFNSIDPTEE